MTQPWDAARAASRRPLRKYKPVGPVGERRCSYEGGDSFERDLFDVGDSTQLGCCKDCGYHICDCTAASLRGRSLDAPIIDERAFFLDLSGPTGKQLTATPEQAKALQRPYSNVMFTGIDVGFCDQAVQQKAASLGHFDCVNPPLFNVNAKGFPSYGEWKAAVQTARYGKERDDAELERAEYEHTMLLGVE